MKKSIILFLSAFIISILSSCSGSDSKQFGSVKEMVDDAKASVKWISADDFKKILESGSKYYLIDCREAEEFDSACIKGAISVPRSDLENTISEKAPKHRLPLYIYCNNGDRSALAANILPLLKYSYVKVITGGFEGWTAAFPDLVELHPVRGNSSAAAPKKSSGGCGG